MKKQVFTLMMTLAIVFGLSVSAWAQAGTTAANPVWHLANSTEDVSVTDNGAGFTYTWTISASDCDGNDDGAASGASISSGAATATITYDGTAAGLYRILVDENNGNCSTVREFFTAVMDVNVTVIASDGTGSGTAPTPLLTCNDYPTLSGTTPSELVVNTIDDLANHSQADWYSRRYVYVTFETGNTATACVSLTVPDATTFPWQFDYNLTGANVANFTDPTNYIGLTVPAGVTDTPSATEGEGLIEVAVGTVAFEIALDARTRWSTTTNGADQSFIFNVVDVVIDGDGGESTANQTDGSNASDEQTIYGRPATSVITN